MSVEFPSIYSQAIGLFDDPSITSAFNNSPIQFFQIMYTYLQNAIPRFNNPMKMQVTLSSQNQPSGQTEIFDGNDTTIYNIIATPLPNSYFEYIVDGNIVNGTYDDVLHSITFSVPIPTGKQGSFQWYFAGEFINDIDYTAINILARLTVLCWVEKEKNFLLDIRRLLGDTDFKLPSEANSVRAKGGWYSDVKSEINKKMNQYAWDLKIQDRFKVGQYWQN